jgi:hypothetical protein
MKCIGLGGNTVTDAPSAVPVVPGPSLAVSCEDPDLAAAVVSPALKAAVPLGVATDTVSFSSSLVLLVPLSVMAEEVIMR